MTIALAIAGMVLLHGPFALLVSRIVRFAD